MTIPHLRLVLLWFTTVIAFSSLAPATMYDTRGSIAMFEKERSVHAYSALTNEWSSFALDSEVIRYGLSEHLGFMHTASQICIFKPANNRWVSEHYIGTPLGYSIDQGTALFWTDEACYGMSTIWTLWSRADMGYGETIGNGASAGNFALVWTSNRAMAYSSSNRQWINRDLKDPALGGLACDGLGVVWTADSAFAYSPIDREWIPSKLGGSGPLKASGCGNVGLVWNQASASAYSVELETWFSIQSLPNFQGGIANENVAFVWTNQTIYVFNALMGHWLPYRPTTDEKSSAGPILPFSDVRLSPNPCSSGLVQFSLPPSNSSWQVVVVDVTGRDVIKKEIPPSTGEAVVELSLSSGAGAPLSGGRYWVYLQSDNRREVRPLVVIR